MTHGSRTATIPARPTWRFPLWIPFLLVWLLLMPLVLLLAPLVFVACVASRVNPLRGVAVYWQVFYALRGLRIMVDHPRAPMSIRIL
jgi:hypothetical protein